MRVLGVDGCKHGWIAIELTDGVLTDCVFAPVFADLVAGDASVIGVDIPLGEPPAITRAADAAARAAITGPGSSSVFNPPPVATLALDDYADANRRCRELTGKGLPKQSWALRTKILDATRHWRADPDRVREVHPEVSFRALAGPIAASKKTWAGHRTRLAALAAAGILLADDLGLAGGASVDDVLDAAVVAWSADRIARGVAVSLPDPPERDADGRAVAIWT